MNTQYPLGIEDDVFWKNIFTTLLYKQEYKKTMDPVNESARIIFLSYNYDQDSRDFFEEVNRILSRKPGLGNVIRKDYEKFLKESSTLMEIKA